MPPPCGRYIYQNKSTMSTDISTIMVALSGGRDISLLGVNNGHGSTEDFAAYVQRVRHEKRLSQRDVEHNSDRGISKGYIGQIENREVLSDSITPQKLRALARGLGVSEDEIFAVARGKPLTYEDPLDLRVLFDGWNEASEEDRAQALDDLKMIAERFQRRRQSKKAPPKGKK